MTAAASPALDEPLLAVGCPTCHAAVAVEQALAGHPARCPICRGGFLVPAARSVRESGSPHGGNSARPQPTDEDRRREARADKSRRRGRRNVVMLFVGVAILLAIVVVLGTKRPKNRR